MTQLNTTQVSSFKKHIEVGICNFSETCTIFGISKYHGKQILDGTYKAAIDLEGELWNFFHLINRKCNENNCPPSKLDLHELIWEHLHKTKGSKVECPTCGAPGTMDIIEDDGIAHFDDSCFKDPKSGIWLCWECWLK